MERQRSLAKAILSGIILALLPLLGAQQFQVGQHRYVAGGGSSSFTHVQSSNPCYATASVSSLTCTMPASIAAGNLLWVCFTNTTSTMTSTVLTGDSGTPAYDMFEGALTGANNSYSYCLYILAAGGGGSSITLTAGNMYFTGITIDEFHRTSGSWVLDVNDNPSPGVATGSGASVSSNSITPSTGDLVLGFVSPVVAGGSTATAAGAGFTQGAANPYSGSSFGFMNEYILSSPGGSIAATATLSGSPTGWLAHVVSFK